MARLRTLLALGALSAASAAASLVAFPEPIFAKYPNLAAALARGDASAAQAADASPAYLLTSLVLSPPACRLAQAVLAALAIPCAFALARWARGPVAGWVAAALLAISAPWLLYAAVLEPDLPQGALTALAAAALVAAAPARGGKAAARAAAAGLALGVAIALRPTALLPAALGVAWLAWERRRAGALAPAVCAAALAAGALLPPAVLHLRAGQPWAATMSAGQVLHQGHRPEGSGIGATVPTLLALATSDLAARPGHPPDSAHGLYREFAAAEAGAPLSAVDAERFWMRKVAAFARAEPGAFGRQLLRKLAFSIAPPGEDADIPEVDAASRSSRVPALPLRAVALLAAAGLALSIRRGGASLLLAAWALAALAVHAVFYFQTRYAVATLPVSCALAGCAVAALVEARRTPRLLAGRAAIVAAPLLLLAAGFVRDEARLQERRGAIPLRSEAVEARRRGDFDAARAALVEEQAALPDALWPWSPHGFALGAEDPALAARAAARARERYGDRAPADAFLLAVLEAQAGRCEAALPLADRAAAAGFHGALGDSSLDPDLLAADCLRRLGRDADALARVRRSLARWPGTLDGLSRLAAAARAAGDAAAAGAAEAELLALHDLASARWALARARRRWGDAAGALAEADALAARLPEVAALAQFERALALADLGRGGAALGAYARALELPFPLHGAARLDPLVRALSAESPDDPRVAQLALAHWSARGVLDEVRAVLRRHPRLAAGEGGLP